MIIPSQRLGYNIDDFKTANDNLILPSLYEIAFNDTEFWSPKTTHEERRRIIMYVEDAKLDNKQRKQIDSIFKSHFEHICKEFDSPINYLLGNTSDVDLIGLSNILKCLLELKNKKDDLLPVEKVLKKIMKREGLSERIVIAKIENLFKDIELNKQNTPVLIQISHYYNQLSGDSKYFNQLKGLVNHSAIKLYHNYPHKGEKLHFESTKEGLIVRLNAFCEIENLNTFELINFLKSMPDVKISIEVVNRNFILYSYFLKELKSNIYQLTFNSLVAEDLDSKKLEDFLTGMNSVELTLISCQGIEDLMQSKMPILKNITSLTIDNCNELKEIEMSTKEIRIDRCHPTLHSCSIEEKKIDTHSFQTALVNNKYHSVINYFSGNIIDIDLMKMAEFLNYLLESKNNNKEDYNIITQILSDNNISLPNVLDKVEKLMAHATISKGSLPQLIRISHVFNQLSKKNNHFNRYNHILQDRGIQLYYKYPASKQIGFESTHDGLKINLDCFFVKNNLNNFAFIEFLESMPDVKISIEVKNQNYVLNESFIKKFGKNIEVLKISSVSAENLDSAKLEGLLSDCTSLNLKIYSCPGIVELSQKKFPLFERINSIEIGYCKNIKTIDLSNAKFINVYGCPNLETIEALNAGEVCAMGAALLTSIISPRAANVNCNNSGCKTLVAPKATKINCSNCRNLSDVEVDQAEEVIWDNVPSATIEQFKKILYENVVKTSSDEEIDEFLKIEKNPTQLSDLFLGDWFIELYELNIPFVFNSSNEQQSYINKMDELIIKFKDEFRTRFGNVNLDWFDESLNKINKLHLKRLLLLEIYRMAVGLSYTDTTVFSDSRLSPLLKVVFTNPNEKVQKAAIFSIVHLCKNNEQEKLLSGYSKLKDQQYLPNLFFITTNLDVKTRSSLLTTLGKTYYQPHVIMTPILEMLAALQGHPQISQEIYSDLVRLGIEEISQGNREPKKTFVKRLNESRVSQLKAVRLISEFVIVNMDLQGIKTCDQLFEREIELCQQLFEVDEAKALKISDAFASKRYPRCLYIYASKMHALKPHNKRIMMKSFLSFIDSVLEGRFPESRYDLESNNHLRKIFESRPELFNQWKAPYIATKDIFKNDEQEGVKPIVERLHDSLYRSLVINKHLGNRLEYRFPTLFTFICEREFLKDKQSLQIAISDLEKNIMENPSDDLILEKKILQFLNIDINASSNDVEKVLNDLVETAKENRQFCRDINDFIENMKQSSTVTYEILCDSDEWEDLLLMGTEVLESCQHIESTIEYNESVLGALRDGKIKIMVIKDQGKIVARSILRALFDRVTQQPVLFMEVSYLRYSDSKLSNLIQKGSIEKAKLMGLPLLKVQDISDETETDAYPNEIGCDEVFGDCEYIDSVGGIRRRGEEYSIKNCRVLYQP